MLSVLILEDEKYTLRFLEKLVSEHPLVSRVFGASNGREAVSLAQAHRPDVVFLDIELSPADNLNGLEVAKAVHNLLPEAEMVFITGYAKYAVDSFIVHPFDYILKPIKVDRVGQALSALAAKVEKQKVQNGINNEKIILKTTDGVMLVNVEDIFFVEKLGKKAYIHSRLGVSESNCTFGEAEMMLGQHFLRVHKSYIVNMARISYIKDTGNQSYDVHFDGYAGTALMSRKRFRSYQQQFSPSF